MHRMAFGRPPATTSTTAALTSWAKVFGQLGLPYLVNQAHTVQVRGKRLTLLAWATRRMPKATTLAVVSPRYRERGAAGPGAASAVSYFAGPPAQMAREYAAQHSVHLHIAGHTHGGKRSWV